MVSTCVDDFDLAGTERFVDMVTEKLSAALVVSKVEDDKYRYTGIDIRRLKDEIEISMDDYANSLQGAMIERRQTWRNANER